MQSSGVLQTEGKAEQHNLRHKSRAFIETMADIIQPWTLQEMTAKDSRHADKAARGKESAMVEMWNAKNVYLLSIEVSNRMLHKYFDKDLPEIHDVSLLLLLMQYVPVQCLSSS